MGLDTKFIVDTFTIPMKSLMRFINDSFCGHSARFGFYFGPAGSGLCGGGFDKAALKTKTWKKHPGIYAIPDFSRADVPKLVVQYADAITSRLQQLGSRK